MNNCLKCGASLVGSKVRTGVSKKTNKPWKAIFCPSCKEPNWLKDDFSQKDYKDDDIKVMLMDLQSKMNRILEMLETNYLVNGKSDWGEEENG